MQEKAKVFKVLTVAAITFIVILAMALTINLIRITTANAALSEAQTKLAERTAEFEAGSKEINYKQTEEYITRYARSELNMKGEGETAFTSK